jgi:hypothetical protein
VDSPVDVAIGSKVECTSLVGGAPLLLKVARTTMPELLIENCNIGIAEVPAGSSF